MAGAGQGGAETAFEDMCLALESAKNELKISQRVVLRNSNVERVSRLRNAGIHVDTLPFGGLLDFYTSWAMKRIIREYEPHIVQTWMARAAAKTPTSKSLYNSHPQTYLKVSRLGGYYSLKYFKTTDYFITITPDIANYLIINGVPADHIRHINNFAESDIPQDSYLSNKTDNDKAFDREYFRKIMQTPVDAVVIICLSRYHQVKGLDLVVQAIVDIPLVHVWLAGEGPERGNLEALAQELGVGDRVHFLGWRNDRAHLLSAADMCVFPSRYEPFGTTFVQAWAHKIPLITASAQGPKQYVHHRKDAIMFDVNSIAQLQSAITELIQTPELVDQLVRAGFERYVNEFSRPKILASYINYYREILERHNIA